ncbi:MAG: glycosyltransferase [Actinomyces ruminicola]|uniref:Glycosyltransferase involved in cell wall bisynthesis n=1 Tax=Actinomyces ruminicola TaxID=332524 RepID=A0A1G9SN16_9ACTO|nr:glycosyltransferase family 4 protein [Actinomyces ruminicola]MBE6482927.1 glycosyltransferase [Actinomyces ruminicola]SDM36801.1 Glycosyltransferase involved in cell wall bisynthesis [Actinomyces ruminicola]
MRVLAVTTWFPTAVAPSRGSFVVNNLHAIGRAHELRVLHLVSPGDDDGTRRLLHEGLQVRRVPMNPQSPADVARAARAISAALRSDAFAPQILHTMAASALEPAALLRPRPPWIHTEHWSALTAPETLPPTGRAALPALRQLLRLPDIVTTDSQFLADGVRRGRGARDTRVVPCIVEPYPPSPRRDRADQALRLVSVGGLIDRKDPLLALDVVAELARRGVDARLTWVGEGPLREAVTERGAAPELAGRITLAGTLDAAGVRAALADADIFLAPTRSDNFFIAVAEAVIAGRPVVTGAKGGQGEYLDPAYSRLVSARDASQWADAVVELDAATSTTPAEAISATVGERFSTAAATRGYNTAYRDLLAPRGEAWSGHGSRG